MADSVVGAVNSIETTNGLNPADCVMLWGHLRPDPTSGSNLFRLYLSLDFIEYVEFDKGEVKGQVDLFGADQPLAGTLVWLKKAASVARKRLDKAVQTIQVETAEQEGEFLTGAIARGFLSQFHAFPMLGLDQLNKKSTDPGSGGGCGTGSPLSTCQ
jgi:hypothetical protein